MLEIYILLIVMIIGSVIALELKDILSSAVIIGAVGLCSSVGFLFLRAPDLAMAQLVVEIVLVVFLIRATLGGKNTSANGGKNKLKILVVLGFIAAFVAAGYYIIQGSPIFGKPLFRISQTYISEQGVLGGVTNVVAGIMLDYRVLDTVGAMIVFFAAVIGVLAIAENNGDHKQ